MLVQNGWKPRRTIVFSSWDANEYGNIGSTESVEAHLPWLDKNAIAYLNIDHAVTGSHFSAQASPLLRRVLYQVASTIINPRTSESVYDTWLAQSKKKHFVAKSSSESFTPPVLPVGTTPGLDTTPFFQHAGISSLSMAFTNGDYGVSRSTFDR
jgi:N-acetylated-alpha-linked acidic dipeptidase